MKIKKKIMSLALSSLLILTNAKFINATNDENLHKDTSEQMILKEQVKNLELQKATYNEKEPNNSKNTATSIGLNSMCYGTTESSYSDYFKFTTTSDGYIDLKFNRNQNVRFYIELYDVNLNTLKYISTEYGTGYENIRMGIPKGTYYVRIGKYSSSNPNTKYSFSVNHTSTTTFEKELNNSSSKANSINTNTTYYGMTESSYSDYFKFTTTSDGYIDLNFNKNQNVRFYVELYDINLNTLKYISTSYGSGYENIRMGIPKGTYYVRVGKYSSSNPDTQYSFKVNYTQKSTFEKEFNNSSSKANNINLNTTYYGMTESSYSDYFRFTTNADGYVDLNFNRNQDVRFYVELYDVNLKTLKYISTEYGTGHETIRMGIPKGTYYVKVGKYSSSNADTQYSFKVNYTKTNIFEKEFNNSATTANSITLNTTYNGMTESSYADYFKFTINNRQNIKVKVSKNKNVRFDAYLLDTNRNIIDFVYTQYGSGHDTISANLASGTYYVKINKYSSSNPDTQYNFMVTNNSLVDINNHWAESTIIDFVNKGYVGGYSDNTFKPNNSITRAEFVSIFNKVFGLTRTSGKVFNDTRNHWAKTSIDIAVTNGVCNGKTATEFKPNDPITREEAAVMISNYKKLADNNLNKLNKFKDAGQVSSWARSSVEGVIEKGYMGGYSDNTYRPKSKITRAEAVVTLSRIK